MKICVLGAGVVGVSTAYTLACLGHEVLVIDKARDVAMGASQANGAQLSYSYIDPLASPVTLCKLPSYLLGLDPATKLRFSASVKYIGWCLSFLRNCLPDRFKANKVERIKLAKLSEAVFETIKHELPGGALQETGKGKLIIAQSTRELRSMQGSPQFIDRDACLKTVPSLRGWTGDIRGGLYAKDDLALNTQTYCKALKKILIEQFSTRFYFGETVQRVLPQDDETQMIVTDKAEHLSDKVIICLGNDPQPVLKPLGLHVPLYPVQGYSLTLPTAPTSPIVSVTDLKHKMVYANLGDKMRIAGFFDTNLKPGQIQGRLSLLKATAQRNWPDVAAFDGPIKTWTDARPMTPSGVPIIGPEKTDGIYLNLGHGSLGYTFAAGSAKKIAMMIGHARKNTSAQRGAYHAI